MAATVPVTRADAQDDSETTLDLRLPTESPSPTHDHSESAVLSMGGLKSEESPTAVNESKYCFSQIDLAGRFEDSNKMYICHLCDFRTAFRNSLLNHQAVHSDFRPWVCNVCEYAAKRKQDLKKHLHTIHGLMVESTMLKPVGLPSIHSTITSGLLSRGESGEENSWDGIKGNKISELDTVYTNSHFLQPVTDLPGADIMTVSIKQEQLELTGQKPLPSMCNFISRSPPESECDLPISFPSVHISKDNMATHAQSMSKLSESSLRSRSYTSLSDKAKTSKDSKVSLNFSKQTLDCDFPLHSFSTPTRKRLRSNPVDSQSYTETSQEHLTPPVKSAKMVDCDELPCSSSVGACHSRSNQTQTSFLCEFCDIMFFQRAMYLMHAGLHSADNPWCCAVCGSSFTEKYSFTSHFINQH
ncbi:unnamed protein product [Candidula unifasciata]|uniref:C2H2-type domain-containing protein n=1 Tax=Candidula unifasciata TaxID=100452 RepID=A0A8S3Z6U3_9EUPU|nr:unnamed protein product [Candidula unifasciata]